MTQERIEQLAEAYASEFEPMFRKVARRAYIDGLQQFDKLVSLLKEYRLAREKFNRACDYGKFLTQQERELASIDMHKAESAVKEFIKEMEG